MWTECVLKGLDDTARLGRVLGRSLPHHAVCLLRGDLAAGKTTLIKQICAQFEIDPKIVISPTYTVANWYHGRVSVCHVDFYRLDSAGQLRDIDQEDWLNPDGPTFIEWPDLAVPLLEGIGTLQIALLLVENDDQARCVQVSSDDPVYAETFTALEQEFGCP